MHVGEYEERNLRVNMLMKEEFLVLFRKADKSLRLSHWKFITQIRRIRIDNLIFQSVCPSTARKKRIV